MLNAFKSTLRFMTKSERASWFFLSSVRSALALLDLAALLALGFVVSSSAAFVTGGSDPDRVLTFGPISLPAANAQSLPWFALGILALFLLKAAFSLALTRQLAYLSARIEARAAYEIADRIFGWDLNRARSVRSEDFIFAIQAGSPSAFNSIPNAMGTLISEITLFVIIGIGFLVIDPIATVFAFAYFGVMAFLIHAALGGLMEKYAKMVGSSTVESNMAIGDLTRVFRELYVSGFRREYINRIYFGRLAAAQGQATQTFLSGMPRYIVEAALIVGVAAFVGVQLAISDFVSAITTIGIFLAGGFRLTAALLPLQSALLSIKTMLPNAERAFSILSLPSSGSRPLEESLLVSKTKGPYGVKVRNLSFTHQDSLTPVLENIDFEIKPGQLVAVMGPSGAGKSTLADLLCLLNSPSQGSIDFVSSSGISITEHQAVSIGYVPQSPEMVNGSIAQNVALGLSVDQIEESEVLRALDIANLSDLIGSLPAGIHTDLGTQRDTLSGGQLQRIGLARALYFNPGLLVLDEATSALDANSEHAIVQALERIRDETTVLIVAHRLNTIQHCDNVFLLESGRLTDSGIFPDLVSRNSRVQALVEIMRIK
jgi:ATP-binding cassette, subfamily B, bacterial PglK